MTDVRSDRELALGVQVIRARTGKVEAHVSAADLERFGYAKDSAGAVERYRAEMEAARPPDESTPSWLDTYIIVHEEED